MQIVLSQLFIKKQGKSWQSPDRFRYDSALPKNRLKTKFLKEVIFLEEFSLHIWQKSELRVPVYTEPNLHYLQYVLGGENIFIRR